MDGTRQMNAQGKSSDYSFGTYEVLLVCSTFALAVAILAFSLLRIDFHADEAIYFSGIPLSTSNDTGLLFHLPYSGMNSGMPTPTSARIVSMLFGVLLLVSSTRIVYRLLPEQQRWLAALVPVLIVVSYQGIFSILRVRPEISWFALSSFIACCLVEIRCTNSVIWRAILISALVLLPMNHLLALFACLFFAGYLLLFGRDYVGTKFSLLAIVSMPVGLALNRAIRTWLIHGQPDLVPHFGSSHTSVPINEFLQNVFWNAPLFLGDASAQRSWWSVLDIRNTGFDGVHCLVANSLWGVSLICPLFFQKWEQRYVASIPLLTLIGFYLSGYFNPTYAPLVVIYSVLIFAFLFAHQPTWTVRKVFSSLVIAVSLLNGASFLSTRIFNHGTATFFQTESELRTQLASCDPTLKIAVAERWQSVVPRHVQSKLILFKDPLPTDIDMVILDHYDFEMYRFVPEYEKRRKEIENALANLSSSTSLSKPVYKRERLFDRVKQNQSIASQQGSWFFRNAVDYKVTVLKPSQTVHISKAEPTNASDAIRK